MPIKQFKNTGGSAYAIMESDSVALRNAAKKARGHGYETGAADEFNVSGERFPRQGNSLIASRDASVTMERSVPHGTSLSAGVDQLGTPSTTVRFRFADGSGYPHTFVRPDGTRIGPASDWMLIVDPANPADKMWIPIP